MENNPNGMGYTKQATREIQPDGDISPSWKTRHLKMYMKTNIIYLSIISLPELYKERYRAPNRNHEYTLTYPIIYLVS